MQHNPALTPNGQRLPPAESAPPTAISPAVRTVRSCSKALEQTYLILNAANNLFDQAETIRAAVDEQLRHLHQILDQTDINP